MYEATGIDKLKTKAFQLELNAFPGKAKKLILLTKVAKIDIVTTHPGMALFPSVNASDDLFFL